MENRNSLRDVETKLVALGKTIKRTNESSFMACCPSHEDSRPSLQVTKKGDKTVMRCWAGCKNEDIVSAMGLTMADLFDSPKKVTGKAIYDYKGANGKTSYLKTKHTPPNKPKYYSFHQPDGTTGKGEVDSVLYNQEILTDGMAMVFLLESEKGADDLTVLELNAVATGGSNNWKPEFAKLFKGSNVILVPHNDKGGELLTNAICQDVFGVADSIRILKLDVPAKGDVSDWLLNGGSLDALIAKTFKAEQVDKPLVAPLVDDDNNPMPDYVLDSYTEDDIEEIQWLWPDRIMLGGLSMLSGDGGVGKGMALCSLAATVTTGGKWPDGSGVAEKGKVIWLTAEESQPKAIVPRLRANGADLANYRGLKGYNRESEQCVSLRDIKMWERMLQQEKNVKLIVIDPITSFMKCNLNCEADVRNVLEPLIDLADDYGVTIIGINHFNKKHDSPISTRAMGSGAFQHVVRSSWVVLPDKEDDEIKCFMPSKANYSAKPMAFRYTLQDVRDEFSKPSSQYVRVMWQGEGFYGHVDDMAKRVDDNGSKVEQATEWLELYLSDGSKFSDEIFDEGREQGHTKSSLYEAKKDLNITAEKEKVVGGKYIWKL